MVERLRAELKAIQEWPCGELKTDTEKHAVVIRWARAGEILRKITEIASRN